jgi:hypothetical protein
MSASIGEPVVRADDVAAWDHHADVVVIGTGIRRSSGCWRG